jgi:hypothetical protein
VRCMFNFLQWLPFPALKQVSQLSPNEKNQPW